MVRRQQQADRALRLATHSPGRPMPARPVEREFWRLIMRAYEVSKPQAAARTMCAFDLEKSSSPGTASSSPVTPVRFARGDVAGTLRTVVWLDQPSVQTQKMRLTKVLSAQRLQALKSNVAGSDGA